MSGAFQQWRPAAAMKGLCKRGHRMPSATLPVPAAQGVNGHGTACDVQKITHLRIRTNSRLAVDIDHAAQLQQYEG